MNSSNTTENKVPIPTTEELIQILGNFLSGDNQRIIVATQFLK